MKPPVVVLRRVPDRLPRPRAVDWSGEGRQATDAVLELPCNRIVVDYWNHNSAYHPLIVRAADGLDGDVLDVGCGEGLLVERLAGVSRQVTGIDRDNTAIERAKERTVNLPNATVAVADFSDMEVVPESFDFITFVAVLHHMSLEPALQRASQLLRPGGQLIVVGLSANKSVGDHVWSAVRLPIIRLLSWVHREARVGLVAIPPVESFAEITRIAHRELPGSHLRQALYYRYILRWTKPLSA